MDSIEQSGAYASREFQGYTPAEMAAASALTRAEDPRWRWVFPVTRTTRGFFATHIPALLASYAAAVLLIFFAAHIEGLVDARLTNLWLAESVANIVVRTLLTGTVIRASPVEVASKPLLRLLPLFAIALAAMHWSWTATIFIGSTLDLTTLVVLLSFVMLSIAVVGLAPASPAICVVYLVPMWSTTMYELLRAEWGGPGTLAIILAAVAVVLWPAFYVVVSGVRRNLLHSDEVDLLVTKLRERNDEVEGLRNAAARDLETRSAFFTSASHDFRQRVHAMKLLAQSGMGPAASARGNQSPLSRLGEVIEDLETYMTDILEFARLESASLDPERKSVRLQSMFQQIDVRFEDIAVASNVDLRIRATPVSLCTDASMVVRILENLVSNAIKFTRARVLLTARRRGSELYVEVRDQGPGVPPDSIDKVFDAFYQGQDTRESAEQGVGLGLAIVKRLTDALGYRMEVVSRPGRGTLMRLVIPGSDLIE